MALQSRRFALLLTALLVLALSCAAGCAPPRAKVTSVWPVAIYEATSTAPADLLALPLTGRAVPDGSTVPTVPVCAKVHDDGSHALTGVGAADVVYETADSGSGTQLACLFQSRFPAQVGPLAPAGMPDLWIVPQYRAMLFSAGATSSLAASMKSWPAFSNASRGQGAPFDAAYGGGRGSGLLLGAVAERLAATYAASVTSTSPVRLRFSASNEATPNAIVGLMVPMSPSFGVVWTWDPATGTYLRSVGGKASRDSLARKRISARNIVVLWVRYTPLDPDLAGGGGFDVTLGGSAQASIFRNGQRFDGKWKANGSSPPRFVAEDGTAIRLSPGNTWFEAIPLSANITLR